MSLQGKKVNSVKSYRLRSKCAPAYLLYMYEYKLSQTLRITRQIFYLFLFCTNRSLKLTTFFCRNWLIQAYHEGEVSFILRDRQKKWVFLSFKLIVLGLSLFEMTTCHLQLGILLYESERFPVEEFIQLINK